MNTKRSLSNNTFDDNDPTDDQQLRSINNSFTKLGGNDISTDDSKERLEIVAKKIKIISDIYRSLSKYVAYSTSEYKAIINL